MSAERRFFLAMLLSFTICILYLNFIAQKRKAWEEEQQQNQANKEQPVQVEGPKQPQPPPDEKQPLQPQQPKGEQPQVTSEKTPEEKTSEQPAQKPRIGEGEEQTITIETDNYLMEWTNKGAGLTSLKLKDFVKNNADKTLDNWRKQQENWLELLPNFNDKAASLLLFSSPKQEASSIEQRDFSLLVDSFWEMNYNQEDMVLEFKLGPTQEGLVYHKVFRFGEKHKFTGKIVVENVSEYRRKPVISLGASAGINWECDDDEVPRYIYSYRTFYNAKQQPITDYFSHSEVRGPGFVDLKPAKWVGQVNRYFACILETSKPELIKSTTSRSFAPGSAWIAGKVAERKERGETASIKELKEKIDVGTLQQNILVLNTKPQEVAPGDKLVFPIDFYFWTKTDLSKLAPNKFGELEYYGYGFFTSVAKLLLWLMNMFYSIFGNYGVAIICLTILIKLCLFPLSRKQQKSMLKYKEGMEKIQPQFKKIKEQYRNNPQKMNQEMMALYKKHNINPIPVGGCLPVFLQLPIFVGLYNALLYSDTLRQQSFLWINDLAQPDHLMLFGFNFPFLGDYLNILPVLVTILWIVQQRSMPQPQDPQMQQQQKVFAFMMVVMGFVFYNLPSGLLLYFLVMNLVTLAEQKIIKKGQEAEKNSQQVPATA